MLIGSIRDIASAEFEAMYYAIEPSSTTELELDESRRLKGRGDAAQRNQLATSAAARLLDSKT